MNDAAAARERIASLCKQVFLFRLIALNVTIFEVTSQPDRAPAVLGSLVLAALASFWQLRMWNRGIELVASPWTVAADLVLTLAIFAYLGPSSPFFLYTLGTALVGGAVHGVRGAVAVSAFLLAGYYASLLTSGDSSGGFPTFVTLPLLYPAAAAGGAAVRRLLDRQAQTESALRGAEAAAVAGQERTRVAREMHDSLGKTLYGIALQATGLARQVRAQAPASEKAARDLAGAAQIAAAQARELIGDLRSDVLNLPLGEALAAYVERWAGEAGVAAETTGEEVDLPHPSTRYELFAIVKEALRNVERHAAAGSVRVSLRQARDTVTLVVADDGVGMRASGNLRELEPDGHWGLIGMQERAERIGATITLCGTAGEGTEVTVRVPAGDVRTPEPWAADVEQVTP